MGGAGVEVGVQNVAMKLSDDADYLAHMRCYGDAKYQEAIAQLSECLARLRLANDANLASFALQRIGHIYWVMGDSHKAVRSFELAECEAPASLVAALAYVTFLADEMGDHELAAKKADKILWAYEGGKFDEESRLVFGTDHVEKVREVAVVARSKLGEP